MNKWLIVAFCSMALVACKKKVEVVKPSTQSITESVYASGAIKALYQYQVFAMASGTIKDILVAEGDEIKANTPLFVLTNQTSKLNTQNAMLNAELNDFSANQNKLNELKVNINFAKSKYENDSVLFKKQNLLYAQKVGSEQDLEQRLLAMENSRALYQSSLLKYADLKRQLNVISKQAKNSLAISERMLDDYTVRSEIAGKVFSIVKERGEMVTPQMPLAVIGAANQFLLELQVDEYDVVKIARGQQVFITLDSYKGQVFEAKVTRINPMMNERTKTFLVEAVFVNQPKVLYPNLTVEANIVIQTKKQALTLPRKCVSDEGYVIKANGDSVRVKTGIMDYQFVEILDGINASDEIVVSK